MEWVESRVTGRTQWSDGLFSLRIEGTGVAPFQAGQFLQLGLPIDQEHLHRPYSVASPSGREIEFFIVRVEQGALTPRLDQLALGDRIDVSKRAAGGFTLEKVADAKSLWLVGTGTGIAPYRAMLLESNIWRRFEKIVLVHGVRFQRDLAYVPEWLQMERDRGGQFRFLPVISRESRDDSLSGRITQRLADGQLESAVGSPILPDSSSVMLCGNPDMLGEMETALMQRGFPKAKHGKPSSLVLERYW
jgi:ferredoxin--NADP+ reductase